MALLCHCLREPLDAAESDSESVRLNEPFCAGSRAVFASGVSGATKRGNSGQPQRSSRVGISPWNGDALVY